MVIGERGNLWQVGHHQHLGTLAKLGKPSTDLDGSLSAHTGINFIEDERRRTRTLRKHNLQSQHDPGEFTA